MQCDFSYFQLPNPRNVPRMLVWSISPKPINKQAWRCVCLETASFHIGGVFRHHAALDGVESHSNSNRVPLALEPHCRSQPPSAAGLTTNSCSILFYSSVIFRANYTYVYNLANPVGLGKHLTIQKYYFHLNWCAIALRVMSNADTFIHLLAGG